MEMIAALLILFLSCSAVGVKRYYERGGLKIERIEGNAYMVIERDSGDVLFRGTKQQCADYVRERIR